jgi:hypothetical protein
LSLSILDEAISESIVDAPSFRELPAGVVSHCLPQTGAWYPPVIVFWHKDLHPKSVSHPKQAYGQESLASTGRSDSAAFCSDWLLSLREGEQLRVLVEAEVILGRTERVDRGQRPEIGLRSLLGDVWLP